MLHRFQQLRAYMGPQFLMLLDYYLDLRRRIKESIDDDSVFQKTRELFTAPDLSHFAITATKPACATGESK